MKQGFATLFLALALTSCGSSKPKSDQANCEQLKHGMSYAQVIERMGQPEYDRITDYPGPGRALGYSTPALASGPIEVELAGTGQELQVVELTCKGQS